MFILFALCISRITSFGLGIDFGSEYIKSAFILPGKNFQFVEDDMSKIKVPNVISFCDQKIFLE